MRRLILSLLVLGLLFALFVAASRYNAGTMDNQDIAALIVQVGALVLVGGAVVLEQGRPTRFDAQSLCTEIRDMARSLRLRNADLFAVAEAIAGHIG